MPKAVAKPTRARRARHPASKGNPVAKRKTRLSEAEQMRRAPPGSLYTNPFASVFTCEVDGKCPSFDALPFVKRNRPPGSGYSYWVVKPSGDYRRDCATGHDYAHKLLPHLKYHGGISLLGSIVLDMIRSGKHEEDRGLVVGFMSELSTQLSCTRAKLAIYATVLANPKAPADVKKELIKNAAPIIKQLGDVL